jgi:cardiolipin synthase
MIMGAVIISWIVDKPVAIRPLVVSKMNTAAQIGLAAGVLAAKAFGWRLEPWLETTLYGSSPH